MKEYFRKLAGKVSVATGSPITFLLAFSVIIAWAFSRPFFSSFDTWQLVINTATTIVTFLMVFLIQNTQNRDAKAMQLKLDELIYATKAARDSFIDLEDLSDDELEALDTDFKKIRVTQADSKVMHALHMRIAKEHERRNGTQRIFDGVNDVLRRVGVDTRSGAQRDIDDLKP
jgi:low affinity Fe/Cu permease